jgi:hypothetical protein
VYKLTLLYILGSSSNILFIFTFLYDFIPLSSSLSYCFLYNYHMTAILSCTTIIDLFLINIYLNFKLVTAILSWTIIMWHFFYWILLLCNKLFSGFTLTIHKMNTAICKFQYMFIGCVKYTCTFVNYHTICSIKPINFIDQCLFLVQLIFFLFLEQIFFNYVYVIRVCNSMI